MVDIYDIGAGWASLKIGECVFDVSYLSDLKSELDNLFKFDIHDINTINFKANKIILEGEGHGDLSLVAYLTFEDTNEYLPGAELRDEDSRYDYILNIIWQNVYNSDNTPASLIKCPYKEFMDEYNNLTKKIKDDYIKNFLCPQDDEEYEEALINY